MRPFGTAWRGAGRITGEVSNMADYIVQRQVTYEAIIRDADSEQDALDAAREDIDLNGDLFAPIDDELVVADGPGSF